MAYCPWPFGDLPSKVWVRALAAHLEAVIASCVLGASHGANREAIQFYCAPHGVVDDWIASHPQLSARSRRAARDDRADFIALFSWRLEHKVNAQTIGVRPYSLATK